jgi:uncharacterized protein (TIGR00369 family)
VDASAGVVSEPTRPGISRTLGYRRASTEPGTATIYWDASEDYCFHTASGPVVQGGLVTAQLDAAMGGAAWSLVAPTHTFLTADLRVEFIRPTRPGPLTAHGTVVRRTSRVIFCAAELFDEAGTLLAASRCTQVVLPHDGAASRPSPLRGLPPRPELP